MTFERLRSLLPPERILVVAPQEHFAAVAAELPEVPSDNLIGEPSARDTANAIALVSAVAQVRDTDAVLGVFPADHLIAPADRFAACFQTGYRAAEQHADALITFGIQPDRPHTGYGYIERGDPLEPGVFHVRRFHEKPDEATARQYLAAGNCYWNSGMFVWRTATILEQIRERLPETHAAVTAAAGRWHDADVQRRLTEAWPRLPKISIDHAVMEHSAKALVVEMPLDWKDVGGLAALAQALPTDAAGNTTLGQVVTTSAANNAIITDDDHLIAAIGVEGLVIVHTPDATLVCRREDTERIKDFFAEIERRFGERYT